MMPAAARRAGELITLDRGGDRACSAANPGLHGLPYTSRHCGCFPISGPMSRARIGITPAPFACPECSGVYTTVNGMRARSEPGDLILHAEL